MNHFTTGQDMWLTCADSLLLQNMCARSLSPCVLIRPSLRPDRIGLIGFVSIYVVLILID